MIHRRGNSTQINKIKKTPNYQEARFFMVNVNRNLAYQSEKSVDGVSENNNNLGSSPKQMCK
jgi:hypothetical protein